MAGTAEEQGGRRGGTAWPRLRAEHVVGAGAVLGVAALVERIPRFVPAREYILCHTSPTLDHLTLTALGLVLAAGAAAVAGGVMMQARRAPGRALPVVWLVIVAALLVAADGVDAHGEALAAKQAATEFTEGACDYVPQEYSATPGWFFW
ncbi:hypothetical protein [Streptomyces sp. TLI_146]|uniref:hypothetical protein n=1 Tax=Streptomyces sp. TLI_146 TaxID=1938858 RepID=UPI000CCA2D5F|nr:hypothetical protein [Streptomyces sp. TLI_146]PKV89437.1 hypothetical protein BX283_7073 [Streptomyces sp. TLI_146]